MHISIRLFATARESIGRETLELDLPFGSTVDTMLQVLKEDFPQFASAPSLFVSVNYEYAELDLQLQEFDEIALIPPVSGGAAVFEITAEPLTSESVVRLVESPECGAVTVFLGTARRMSRGREVEYLEYEAYAEMAIHKLRQIAVEIEERWATDRLAIRHRTGRIDLGEVSVAIAVATEHRAEGFAACQYAIDRLKEIVPIWKKEVWVGGGEWVGWDCTTDPIDSAIPAAQIDR